MPHSILEKAGEHIADSVREASRVTAAVADAFDDGLGVAKRAAKQSGARCRRLCERFNAAHSAKSAGHSSSNVGRRLCCGISNWFGDQAQVTYERRHPSCSQTSFRASGGI